MSAIETKVERIIREGARDTAAQVIAAVRDHDRRANLEIARRRLADAVLKASATAPGRTARGRP